MSESLIMILAWIIASGIYLSPIAIIVIIIRTIKKKKERKENENQIGYKVGIKPLTFPDKEPKSYPSGWTFNEETKLWDPPAHMKRKEPTYEEWREAQLKKENESAPKNQMTGEGTYRYDYIHMPSEEIRHYHHTDTDIVIKKEIVKDQEQIEPEEPKLTQREIELLKQYREMAAEGERKEERLKPKTGYEEAYEAKPLLTKNESRNFKALREAANRNGYIIQAKVRLADIVMPKKGDNFYSNFGRVKSRHVDFAICNEDMKVIAVVELDDSSHDNPKSREIDAFKNSILESNGIKVIRTRHITTDILDNL